MIVHNEGQAPERDGGKPFVARASRAPFRGRWHPRHARATSEIQRNAWDASKLSTPGPSSFPAA